MKKLAIVTTHPIQYYAPVFKLLYQRGHVNIKVFYTWGQNSVSKYDPGFNKKIEWDIPLLEGYPYAWLKNTAKHPGTHHFTGIKNPCIINTISEFMPDAILVYGWGFISHLKAIRYFKNKIPVYFRGDSNLLDEKQGLREILRTFFLKWVYKHIDHAFFVGTNNKDYYLKYGLKEGQLSFAPHAIDNERFAIKREGEVIALKKELGINSNELLTLFAGKLEDKKAPLLLLEAFISLKMAGVHLLYVGNGPLEKQLKQKAFDNKFIHFLDFQNQSKMPVIYQACDIFCLPSIGPNETWGLTVNEAMACGKAILSSDSAGCSIDLVKPGFNGYICKSGDWADFASKLNMLFIEGKSEIEKLGQNSKGLIKNWRFESQVKAIELKVNNEK